MRIFEIIKENVNLREAAELYGIDVNRYGKALCPFHNDRHPSLYVADDHYYCFACGEHGDVIDFVGRLFQLSPYNAARKLMADFHLSPDKPPSAAALHAKRIRTEAQQLMENERLCFSVLSDYARVLRDWKMRYTPQSPDVPVHACSWKPVTSSTRRNITWIFFVLAILLNVPKWCSSRWQGESWTGCGSA